MANVKVPALPEESLAELDPANTLLYAVDLSEALPADQDKKLLLGTLAAYMATQAPSPPKTITHAMSPYAVLVTDRTLLADTSGGVVQITLRAAPVAGRVLDIKKITPDATLLTIARNGKKIENAAVNLTTLSALLPSFTLEYDATAGSWWII